MSDRPDSPDAEHRRLQQLQHRVNTIRGDAQRYDTLATSLEKQLAHDEKTASANAFAGKHFMSLTERDELQARAEQLRSDAAERRERADALSQEVVTGWQMRPELRPNNVPGPTMAEMMRAAELKSAERERTARELGRDRDPGGRERE